MNDHPEQTPPPPSHTSNRRFVVLVLCIGAAVAAAFVTRKSEPVSDAAPPQPVAQTPEQILAAIPQPEGSSDTDRALAAMLGKVRTKPHDPVAWVNLGDTLAQLLRDTADEKYYDHAESAYQSALRLDPRGATAMVGMAWVTGGRHDFNRGREWATRALAIDPGSAEACGILGDADLELGEYDAAFGHYQKMMDLKPDLSSWSRGAHLLWLTGDTEKAIWLMEKAIKAGAPFAENTAWCRARLAMMLFNRGAFDAAAQALEPCLESAPKNSHVLLAAGRIAAARRDRSAAEVHFKTILETGANHDALAALGDLHAAKGEATEAEAYYAKVEALETQRFAAAGHSHIAMAKFYADHDRKLIDALRMAEERKLTSNVHEADTLAWVYLKNGDLPRATDAIKRALSQNTPDPEIHFHAGMIAAKSGDRIAAQTHLQRALSLNPQFSLSQVPIAVAALHELGGNATATASGTEGPAR